MNETFVNTGRNGIIKTDARSACNTPHVLTQLPITEAIMAKQSLPKSNFTIKTCLVSGCQCKYFENGYCSKHYARMRRKGVLTAKVYVNGVGETPEERFWSRVNRTADINQCWNWTGGLLSEGGYGRVVVNGKAQGSHRAAWYYTYGVMPTQFVLHSCDNRQCVNPNHLREGTVQDNADDRVSRQRQARGETVGTSKLTASEVVEIRQRYADGGVFQRELAAEFGVDTSLISLIILRKQWTHITEQI